MGQILIVEDEFIIAMSIQSLLEGMGHSVVEVVHTGEEAIEVAEAQTPDLVLMDIELRGAMNGMEAAHHIYKRLQLPIIYLTAYTSKETLDQAKMTQPFGYLVKPVKQEELRATIEMALVRHDLERKLAAHDRWLSAMLEAVESAVVATDNQSKVQFMNQVAARWIGVPPEEAKGKLLSEILRTKIHTLYDPSHTQNQKGLAATLDIWQSFPVIRLPDGQEIPVEITIQPVASRLESVQGTLYTFRDMSPSKHTQETLEAIKNNFREFMNEATCAILIHDLDGDIVDSNPKANNLLRYSQSDLQNLNLSDFMLDIPGNGFRSQFRDAESGKSVPLHHVYQRKDDVTFPATGVIGLCATQEQMLLMQVFTSGIAYDRHVRNDVQEVTFRELYQRVCQIASRVAQLSSSLEATQHFLSIQQPE